MVLMLFFQIDNISQIFKCKNKQIFNIVTLLSNALDDLYRNQKMTKSQASEYLKLKDMLKPGYKPNTGEPKMSKVQIRQRVRPLYLEVFNVS